MWSWIIKVAVVSFLFIFLLHYLYSFFKTTLTSPKIKDLVNKPMRKYDSIYDSLQNSQSYSYMDELEGVNANMSKILNSNPLTAQNPVKQNMKDELKRYLSELSDSSSSSSNITGANGGIDIEKMNESHSIPHMTTSAIPTIPTIPDFSMSSMSSSTFSSSYAEF